MVDNIASFSVLSSYTMVKWAGLRTSLAQVQTYNRIDGYPYWRDLQGSRKETDSSLGLVIKLQNLLEVYKNFT